MWSSFSSILVEKAPRRTRRRKKKKSTRRVCARFANSEDFFLFLQRSVEMAEEFVDIVVLGASGFTGKYVLRELLKFRNVTGREPRKIGIAGRSKKKLAAALTWAAAAASSSSSSSSAVAGGGNDPDNASPPSVVIYEADVNDMASLRAVCRKTRVLVSCVGPYRKYGQPVVEACVEAGVDYLDITGEPEFMERMEVLYHEKAKQSGHRIKGNLGTWESAVLGVTNMSDIRELRKSRPRRARPQIPGGPAKKKSGWVHWEENAGGWAIRFPTADPTVVRRTHSTVVENPSGLPTADNEGSPTSSNVNKSAWASIKPVHYGCYLIQKSIIGVIAVFVIGCLIAVLSAYKFGQKLLIQYPEIFSLGIFHKEGPSEEEVRAASFKMWFVGRGYSDSKTISPGKEPDKQVLTRVSGPEIGYVTTPIVCIQAALLMLDERKHLPKGGVYTPATVFSGTDYLQRLQRNGLHFDVISTTKI
ncbi:hypothetical protein CY35_06G077900 [Sphagnum magellanicum]|nr:hypothetical protein CY35_06G077900 [Sphagnum magellanicum]